MTLAGWEIDVVMDGWSAYVAGDGRDAAGRGLPSGIYLARVRGEDADVVVKVMLAR